MSIALYLKIAALIVVIMLLLFVMTASFFRGTGGSAGIFGPYWLDNKFTTIAFLALCVQMVWAIVFVFSWFR